MTNVVDEREPKAGNDVQGDSAQPELAGTAPAPEDKARPRAKRRRNRRRRKGKVAVSLSASTAAESTPPTAPDTQAPSAAVEGEPQPDRGEAARLAAENGAAQAAPARRRKRRLSTAAPRPRRFPLARELREQLRREWQMALDTRDPLAIRLALDRYDVITAALEGFSDDAEVDLDSITLGISQAAKALGYTPFQVREMIKLRKLAAHKVNNQWRIPLKLVW